jgi:hypothetical protein
MWVDLRDNAEVDVEMKVECFERDIGTKTAVLPFVAERIGEKTSVSSLHHQHHGIQDARDSS